MTHLSGTFTGIGVAPQVESAEALSRTRVRVTFTEPMLDTAALRAPGTYTITADGGSDARSVASVEPENATDPGFVDLLLTGPLTYGSNNYNVQVATTLTDPALNTLDADADDADFGIAAPIEAEPAVEDPIHHIGLLDQERYRSGWGIGMGNFGASDERPQYLISAVDHAVLAKRRLIAQYQDKAKINAFVGLFAGRFQDLEDIAALVLVDRGLDTSFGSLLDAVGERVGIAREGREDNTYRIRLAGQIIANASGATAEDVRAVLEMLLQGTARVVVEQAPPCTTILRVFELIQGDGEDFARIVNRAVAAGTRCIVEWELPLRLGSTFGFESDNDAGPWAEFAEDSSSAGLWAEGSDGG